MQHHRWHHKDTRCERHICDLSHEPQNLYLFDVKTILLLAPKLIQPLFLTYVAVTQQITNQLKNARLISIVNTGQWYPQS